MELKEETFQGSIAARATLPVMALPDVPSCVWVLSLGMAGTPPVPHSWTSPVVHTILKLPGMFGFHEVLGHD